MTQWTLILKLLALLLMMTAMASADSNIRMVRLTSVQGDVRIDSADGRGISNAVAEMPVASGARILTGTDGLAEVEFEDGSVLRITSSSTVSFNNMELLSNGQRSTMASLDDGEMYFEQSPNSKDHYELDVRRAQITPEKGAQLRASLDKTLAKIAVTAGTVEVQRGNGEQVEVRSDETLTLDFNDLSRYFLAEGVSSDPNDAWVEQRSQDLAEANSSLAYNGYGGYLQGGYAYPGYSAYPGMYGLNYGPGYGYPPYYGYGNGYGLSYGYGMPGYFSDPYDWDDFYGFNNMSYGGMPSCGSYFLDTISGQWIMNADPTWDSFSNCPYNYSPYYPSYWYPQGHTKVSNPPPPPMRFTGTPTVHPVMPGGGGVHPTFIQNEDKHHGRVYNNQDFAPATSDGGAETMFHSSPSQGTSSGTSGRSTSTPTLSPRRGSEFHSPGTSRGGNSRPAPEPQQEPRPRVHSFAMPSAGSFGGMQRSQPSTFHSSAPSFHSGPPSAGGGGFSMGRASDTGRHH